MDVKIVSMHLENFKGIKELSFRLGDKTEIKGRNASGKSTIATAIFWLLADKDISLASNPKVQPLGVVECSPTVTATLDVDGKLVTLTKKQTTKKSKPNDDGIVKISMNNTYEINSVPKTERDFKAYLEELNLPSIEELLLSMHTEVFASLKQADMRAKLFEMTKSHTDLEIAKKVGNIPDVAQLLDNYKLEEILAMNKATIKRCNEQLESIPAKIEGLESAKVDVDVSEFELQKNSLKKEIDELNATIEKLSAQKEKSVHLMTESLRLEFAISDEIKRINESNVSGKAEIEKRLVSAKNSLSDAENTVARDESELRYATNELKDSEAEFERLKDVYTSAKESKFDVSKGVCPCCGQAYPEDKVSSMVKAFEDEKKSKMSEANIKAKNVNARIKSLKEKITFLEDTLKSDKAIVEEHKNNTAKISTEYENFTPSDVQTSDTLEKLKKEREEIDEAKNGLVNVDDEIAACKAQLINLNRELENATKRIALSENNVQIDNQIEELSAKRLEYEQSKADAEKILYECDLLSKAKNEILADDINSNFALVKFKFFDYLKNGNYKECCLPIVDGKELGVATNTALEVEAKVDICRGLQRFYGCNAPIIIDNAECLDSKNMDAFNLDSQLIFCKVTDDDLAIS